MASRRRDKNYNTFNHTNKKTKHTKSKIKHLYRKYSIKSEKLYYFQIFLYYNKET